MMLCGSAFVTVPLQRCLCNDAGRSLARNTLRLARWPVVVSAKIYADVDF
jgi:hypothetical protein